MKNKAAWPSFLRFVIRHVSFAILVLLAACMAGVSESPNQTPIVVTRAVDEVIQVEVQGGSGLVPGTELRILQWSHFVPAYDLWFDEFAQAWGAQYGIDVTVDHIDIDELGDALAAELAQQSGHTLVELPFSPSAYIEGLHDLTEVNLQAQSLFGDQVATCRATSYLPTIDSYYAFCHGYVPDPGNYRADLWQAVGYPNGPQSYDDLLEGGSAIRTQFGVPVGIGLSPEIDSENAVRAVIWSFGGSVQDVDENVVLNSAETIAAVDYIASLYEAAMPSNVFDWDPSSNNAGLIDQRFSYILNSLTAYRSLQKVNPEAANQIYFTPALSGPAGAFVSSHTWQVYAVPRFVTSAEFDVANAFMLHLIANYNQATFNSELYNFPAFPSTVPQLFEKDGWLENDPFLSEPSDKLSALPAADTSGVQIGYPGVSNPAIGEVYTEHVLTQMVARVVRGELSSAESVAQATAEVEQIFDGWRDKGLVGGSTPAP